MTNKKSNESRRKLLKSIAAGSGAIVAGKSLPESWSRPVVDSVMLPAHAQTSQVALNYTSTDSVVTGGEWLEPFLTSAHADVPTIGEYLVSATVCVFFNTDMTTFSARVLTEIVNREEPNVPPTITGTTEIPINDKNVGEPFLIVTCGGTGFNMTVDSGPNEAGVSYSLCISSNDAVCLTGTLTPGPCPVSIGCDA